MGRPSLSLRKFGRTDSGPPKPDQLRYRLTVRATPTSTADAVDVLSANSKRFLRLISLCSRRPQQHRSGSELSSITRSPRNVKRSKKSPGSASGGSRIRDCYWMIFATTPAPTVRPPSRIAKRRPSSIAIGAISVTTILMLSPGMTISTPSGSSHAPVTSVVRK